MGDEILHRFRVDFHSIAVGFKEPASAHIMKRTFENDFGEVVPFQRFGYMSFEAFLNDHPDLERVTFGGETSYRAKVSQRTADIQSLVARQKDKKQKRRRGAQTIQAPVIPAESTTSNKKKKKNRGRKAAAKLQLPVLQGNGTVDPEAGKARILRALKLCSGKATLTKLNFAYQGQFGAQLDSKEMKKYFGTRNFRKIQEEWLADDLDLIAGYGGQWTFLSTEIANQQDDWYEKHKHLITTYTPVPLWDKPTLKELLEKVVAMLVNMFPQPLQVSKMTEIYKRSHGVVVDPEELYSKSWEELVGRTFHDKMNLQKNGNVVLSQKSILSHGLSSKKALAPASGATVKRVTADDLGLGYESEYEDEDEEEEEMEVDLQVTPQETTIEGLPAETDADLQKTFELIVAEARQTQPSPPRESTSGFSFMAILGKRTGFGVKRAPLESRPLLF